MVDVDVVAVIIVDFAEVMVVVEVALVDVDVVEDMDVDDVVLEVTVVTDVVVRAQLP